MTLAEDCSTRTRRHALPAEGGPEELGPRRAPTQEVSEIFGIDPAELDAPTRSGWDGDPAR
jgi:hypothetical protein